MSNETTKKMLSLYEQTAPTSSFFASMFKTPPENYHNSETVEIDIDREDEDIAVAIKDLSTGYKMSATDIYTNKEFKPPIFKEAFPINAFSMINRMAGDDPFRNPEFQASAMKKFVREMKKAEKKIRRTMELQASQVLQSGIITLVDDAGATQYTIDYKPKATHFPTASPVWDGVSPKIANDMLNLANVIRNDGLVDVDEAYMDETSFEVAMADTEFSARFEGRRLDLGEIAGAPSGTGGGNFRGIANIGNYPIKIFTYGGRYKHPQTGTKTLYLPKGKCVMRASGGRLDATFGNIPRIVSMDRRVLPFLPRRTGSARGVDMITNAWVTPDGEQLFGSVGARPLMIPTAIDTFGCISTGVS